MKTINYDSHIIGPTYTGKIIDILNLDRENIDIKDIAHNLSMQCRYAGSTKVFYSVAEHSVIIANKLYADGYDAKVQMAGLLHDASEYLLGDIVRPIRRLPALINYANLHAFLQSEIMKKFLPEGIEAADYLAIEMFDKRICLDEKEALLTDKVQWDLGCDKLDVEIIGWIPNVAEMKFMITYHNIKEQMVSVNYIKEVPINA